MEAVPSPSHPVGSEHKYCKHYYYFHIGLHPTRWAWNKTAYEYLTEFEQFRSPSHTVGLEQGRTSRRVVLFLPPSPSHTVGSERGRKRPCKKVCPRSPSHTVGSEQVLYLSERKYDPVSPSHTVGLELCHCHRTASLRRSHHPTRWAWNEEKILLAQTL